VKWLPPLMPHENMRSSSQPAENPPDGAFPAGNCCSSRRARADALRRRRSVATVRVSAAPPAVRCSCRDRSAPADRAVWERPAARGREARTPGRARTMRPATCFRG
jgi:hypothetical protein